MTHPSTQFEAPHSIPAGSNLAALFGEQAIDLIWQCFRAAGGSQVHVWDSAQLARESSDLGLMQRATFIADALQQILPQQADGQLELAIASLGPKLTACEDNGLAVFFYLPWSKLIERHVTTEFELGMQANAELTQRFTAEFSIRPYLIADLDRCMPYLTQWSADVNPHLRRLVSEGTRPRLPWGCDSSIFSKTRRRYCPS